MKIGIIFAMEEELNEFMDLVTISGQHQVYDLTIYDCTLNDKKLALATSGVGKVNAARTTQILIDKENVNTIINVGVAGSLSKDVNITDIVLGEKLVQHDFDITAFGHAKGYVPNIGVYVKSDEKLLSIAEKVKTNDIVIHKGVIASGDIFCTDKTQSEKINRDFEALCVEMEGASVAQTSFQSNIPFLVIRSISDSIDGSNNKMTHEEFLEKSSKIVADFLKELLLKY